MLLDDDVVDWDAEFPPQTGEEYSQSKRTLPRIYLHSYAFLVKLASLIRCSCEFRVNSFDLAPPVRVYSNLFDAVVSIFQVHRESRRRQARTQGTRLEKDSTRH